MHSLGIYEIDLEIKGKKYRHQINVIDQLIFITKVFNEIQTGRALLTSPRGIGFSRSQPAVYLELLQLYYDPFITSSMNDAQNCLSPSYRHPAVVEFIETTLVRFRTSATNRLKQEPIPLLQESLMVLYHLRFRRHSCRCLPRLQRKGVQRSHLVFPGGTW